MRIGLSIATHPEQSVWENGLGQNVFFLLKLLRSSPLVEEVVLLNCGTQPSLPREAETLLPSIKMLAPREATEAIDVVIEMGGGLDVEWLDHMRARGKKVVFLCCSQPYVGLIEPSVFKREGYYSRAQRCDEIWVLPKDRVFRPMLETMHRCPVFEVPFLWDPMFVEARAKVVESAGFSFGYVPKRQSDKVPHALRAAIFEPNISVVKCCMIPMLAADIAYRIEPESVAQLRVLNSAQLKGHATFDFALRATDLNRDGKVVLDHRHDFVAYMAKFGDAVIAHHWQNDQNILHLDALYGGYPVIHNSEWLSHLGYYYPAFDAPAAAQQLVRAAREHDTLHEDYAARAREFLATLSPHAPDNTASYLGRLLHLNARSGRQETTW